MPVIGKKQRTGKQKGKGKVLGKGVNADLLQNKSKGISRFLERFSLLGLIWHMLNRGDTFSDSHICLRELI